jgi:gluconolactonase
MKSKAAIGSVGIVLGLAFVMSQAVIAQENEFPQPAPPKEVTVTAIPGVVAAGAKWQLIWGQDNNADGLAGTADEGILFGQEQPSYIGRIDKKDKYSVAFMDTHGTGAVGIDMKGGVYGIARTCTDPGGKDPEHCAEPTALWQFSPMKKMLTNNDGKGFGRLDDLEVAKNGGIFLNGRAGVFYYSPSGKLTQISDNPRTNGVILSPDEKTFYTNDRTVIIAYDVQPDGTCTNMREFAKLHGGGADGMAVDSIGRVYIATGAGGVQVFGTDGTYLGTIPLPRPVASVAFSGPGKKWLYAQGRGATGPDGQEMKTAPGVRNDAKSIYKIEMISEGYKGRPK